MLLTPLLHPQSLKRATALIQPSFACCLQSQPCPLGISASSSLDNSDSTSSGDKEQQDEQDEQEEEEEEEEKEE